MCFCLWCSKRRYRTAQDVPADFYRSQRQLSGYIAGVPDGDGLRIYHQPRSDSILTGCLAPGKPNFKRLDLRNETISVRLAGVDAPEMAHFGNAEQPYAKEAVNFLKGYLHYHCR